MKIPTPASSGSIHSVLLEELLLVSLGFFLFTSELLSHWFLTGMSTFSLVPHSDTYEVPGFGQVTDLLCASGSQQQDRINNTTNFIDDLIHVKHFKQDPSKKESNTH